MKNYLEKLYQNECLDREESYSAMLRIADASVDLYQVAAFLSVYNLRPIRIAELEGFRDALVELSTKIDFASENTIDVCGTGGDGKNTFNISTLSAFVIAGAGIKVAKHGNHGVSSISGSSTVLEYLGYSFTNVQDQLKRQLDQANICFLHAPLFHPALKNVSVVRKSIGLKTFFNMLGPMVNPSRPKNQLVGVYSLELARIYAQLYQRELQNYSILHDLEGYDEFSLTGKVKVFTQSGEDLLQAKDMGCARISPEAIYGGSSIEAAAKLFMTILNNAGSLEQQNTVCANAALSIKTVYPELDVLDAFQIARESLNSGKALNSFKKMMSL